jgi:hypothetical protein
VPAAAQSTATLKRTIAEESRDVRQHRNVLRFLANHPHLLAPGSPDRPAALRLRAAHSAGLRTSLERLLAVRATLRRARAAARRARIHELPPAEAIRRVFGASWRKALAVARCESTLRTTARNGQYRGLFQLGSPERARFGHGESAYAQARAAHRYWVEVGRSWHPWPVCGRVTA